MWKLVVAFSASLLIIGGAAIASIPDADGVIHGCRKKADGSLRVIDTDRGQTCVEGERRLNWSQAGPPGQDGAPGQDGDQGIQGIPGPGGITDRLTTSVHLVGDNQQGSSDVTWTQSPDSVNVAWARATVMWDTAYDGCGSSPDVGVEIKSEGSPVGVFEHMKSRTAVTVLDPLQVDQVFWADAAIGRSLTVSVRSGCGTVDVDLDVWIEEVA